MLIYDDVYTWEGWGGLLSLEAGKCRLKIFDLRKASANGVVPLKSFIVIVSEVPLAPGDTKRFVSLRSHIGHIATLVAREFRLDRPRTLWVEFYPEQRYGVHDEKVIPERYDEVNFTWQEDRALEPKWTPINPPLLDMVRQLQVHGRLGQDAG